MTPYLDPVTARLAVCNTRLRIIECLLLTNPPAEQKRDLRIKRFKEIERRQAIKQEMSRDLIITIVNL